MRVRCDILGRMVDCFVGAPGAHIAQNVVAALTAVSLLDGDVLNAAAAFLIGDKVETLRDGVTLAQAAIDDGRAKAALDRLIEVTAA